MQTEHNAMLAALINSTDDAIISTTTEGMITTWNAGATRIFGYCDEEAIGQSVTFIIPEDRHDEKDMVLERIGKGKRIHNFETIRLAKDGSQKFVSISISPIIDEHDRVMGNSIIARDISQKKIDKERQATLAAIVDSSDDAIVSKTLDGIITSWNKAAQRMFGFSEEEAIGKHISIIIPPERIEEETMIISNIRSGRKIDHFETVRRAKDGTDRFISLTISPVKDGQGKIIGASKIARDISMRIQAEKQKELYIQRLHELNQYKDEFMVMASHELKTPLTVILANLQILEHMMKDDPFVSQLRKTIEKTQKMADLVSNLLDVSKVQSGKLDLNISSFDINEVISEIVSSMQSTTKNHNFIFDNPPPLIVKADAYRIEQVLINIIGNAIKYAPNGGNITITTGRRNGYVQIEITDEGIGIPAVDHEKIFERFYRSSGKAKSFSGSGVGLYISSEIIRKHQGDIFVKSEEGKGSSFVIRIPG